jgi:hypothetical protein
MKSKGRKTRNLKLVITLTGRTPISSTDAVHYPKGRNEQAEETEGREESRRFEEERIFFQFCPSLIVH